MFKNLPDYLSDDQMAALETVMDCTEKQRVTIMTGPAGSGKSTLTQEIINLSTRHTVLGAPTGKAALVLKAKSGHSAKTIHSLLYGGARYDEEKKRLIFFRPDAPCGHHDLLLVDEGSMVGTKLWKDLMEHVPGQARVLVIGDKEQLSPVRDSWGPDLDNADARLTKVHRQAEKSQIIRYATAIREGRGDRWEENEYDASDPDLQVYDNLDNAVEWLVDARERNEDATLLTYTHEVRKWLNHETRIRLGLYSKYSPFMIGDKLVVRSNNHSLGLMNGEVVTIADVYEKEEDLYGVRLLELPDFETLTKVEHLEANANDFQRWRENCGLPRHLKDLYLHFHYGQCLTVHSSQGSQWTKAGVVIDSAFRRKKRESPEEGRRFLYTAVTRAAESLAVFTA